MVFKADVQDGFSGYRANAHEFDAVDPAFRDLCVAAVESAAPESLLEMKEFRGELTLYVRRESIKTICLALRDHPELQFNYLTDITAIDYLPLGRDPRFDVIYHLYSIPRSWRLRLHAPVSAEDCRIDSVVEVWRAADWNERETFDFFGIVFEGHPDLRRILLPEDWQGYPLRKDFPLGGKKSFYYKKATEPYAGETEGMVPRIRKNENEI